MQQNINSLELPILAEKSCTHESPFKKLLFLKQISNNREHYFTHWERWLDNLMELDIKTNPSVFVS